MTLADIRDYVETLGIADYVYMSTLPHKPEKAVGVYNTRRAQAYSTAIGGPQLKSYGTKYLTCLVHWNKSPRETEEAAAALFEALRSTREFWFVDYLTTRGGARLLTRGGNPLTIYGNRIIKFILPLYEIQDVGTDEAGVCEMVIEVAVIYRK